MHGKQNERPDINESPFSVLIASSPTLKKLRTRYASASDTDRQHAAEFVYSSDIASQLFQAFAPDMAGGDGLSGPVEALAIDPDFAPALLSVGSIEYQLGRHEEAMGQPRQQPVKRHLSAQALEVDALGLCERFQPRFQCDPECGGCCVAVCRLHRSPFFSLVSQVGSLSLCASLAVIKPRFLASSKACLRRSEDSPPAATRSRIVRIGRVTR